MSDEIEVRKMKDSDVGQVIDMMHRLKRLNQEFDPTFQVSDPPAEEVRESLNEAIKQEKKHILLVADADGKAVGIVKADIHDRIYYLPRQDARITEFYVMPEFRRRMLGRKLISELYRELKKRNITMVSAEFPSSNLIALGFYRGLGYRNIVSVYGRHLEES